MSTCCCISGEPIEDVSGRLRTHSDSDGRQKFRTSMLDAPFAQFPTSFCWCVGQFCCPGCAQYALRKRVLDGDMRKYSCFQGYFSMCCISAGSCNEHQCPDLCAFMEGCCCNCIAISASRAYVMEQYHLASDPCDYRLIRINNFLQVFACICDVISSCASEDRDLYDFAQFIDWVANTFYYCISGCMTAQVAVELEHQAACKRDSTGWSAGSGRDESEAFMGAPSASQLHSTSYGGSSSSSCGSGSYQHDGPYAQTGSGYHHHQHHQPQPSAPPMPM